MIDRIIKKSGFFIGEQGDCFDLQCPRCKSKKDVHYCGVFSVPLYIECKSCGYNEIAKGKNTKQGGQSDE